MKINKKDWVLYKENPTGYKKWCKGLVKTKYERFDKIPNTIAKRLQTLANRYIYSEMISYDQKYGNLQLILITNEKGEKYAQKLDFLFKALNKPYTPFKVLSDSKYLKHPYSSFTGLLECLNKEWWGDETKKSIAVLILDMFLNKDDYYDNCIKEARWLAHLVKIKINHLKKELERMKNLDKFLVELTRYDKETKKNTSDREFAFIYNVPEEKGLTPKDMTDILKHSFINPKDKYDVLHNILTIKGNNYVINSGHTDFTGERWDNMSNKGEKEPIIDIDYERGDWCKINGLDKEYIFRPQNINLQNIVNYYKEKTSNKNISSPVLIEKVEKKDKPGPKQKKNDNQYYWELANERAKEQPKERTNKMKDFDPSKAEEDRDKKVCLMNINTGRIYRIRQSQANIWMQDGIWEYCQKKFWKKQIYNGYTKEGEPIIVSTPAKWDKDKKRYILPITTNINKSMYGRKLGERNQKKQLHQEERNAYRLASQNGHRLQLEKQKIYIKPKEELQKVQRKSSIRQYKKVFITKTNKITREKEPWYIIEQRIDENGKIYYVQTDKQMFKLVPEGREEFNYDYEIKPKGYYKTLIHRKNKKRIPGDVERQTRSAQDSADYIHSLKGKNKTSKNPVWHKADRAWEYEMTFKDKESVKGNIKAKSEKEAKDKLTKFVTNKKPESYKLTGNVRDWVTQSYKQRPKNRKNTRGPGTLKPRKVS